ncbi:hypothetical protein SEA_UPYO_38 [Gordonia phage Upyo]|nr:hypothetical protein SEA_UPYO_38 [Gordonia phage Upyo]
MSAEPDPDQASPPPGELDTPMAMTLNLPDLQHHQEIRERSYQLDIQRGRMRA